MDVGAESPGHQSACSMVSSEHLLGELTQAVLRILADGRHADRVIERLLRQRPPRDEHRRLIAQTVYGVVRHYRRLVWALNETEDLSAEQISRCIRAWWVLSAVPMAPSLRAGLPPRRTLRQRWEHPPSRAIRFSFPDWLDRYAAEQCGHRWETIAAAFEQEPRIILRTNTLKILRDDLLARLRQQGIDAEPHPTEPDAIVLGEYRNVFALEEFHAGLFEMQDAASQALARLLDVAPGMFVVDACAGSGGKTLHLAALMQNRGRIIALDTASWKLDELRRRAARADVSIIQTRPITSTKVIKRLAGRAERLLLDLPCSGSGVWRRNPDGKWHLTPEDIPRLQQLQRQILSRYLPMLAPTGRALICTCSIFPAEGEQLCHWLAAHGRWHILQHGRFDPSTSPDQDGFFWAIVAQQ